MDFSIKAMKRPNADDTLATDHNNPTSPIDLIQHKKTRLNPSSDA